MIAGSLTCQFTISPITVRSPLGRGTLQRNYTADVTINDSDPLTITLSSFQEPSPEAFAQRALTRALWSLCAAQKFQSLPAPGYPPLIPDYL